MQAAGKTIAVTGGGNGIGRELVLNLLNKGARVAAIIGAHGQVDGLINCAGIIQPFVKVNDLDYASI